MSVLLEGSTEIKDEEATWSGMWQFAKDKKAGVSFKYQWESCSLPRDLLDYVSFIPSPNDPIPLPISTTGRGRGRGRGRASSSGGRGSGRGVARGGRTSISSSSRPGSEGETSASVQHEKASDVTTYPEDFGQSASLGETTCEDSADQNSEMEKNAELIVNNYDTGRLSSVEADNDNDESEDVLDTTLEADASITAAETDNDACSTDAAAAAFDDVVVKSAGPVLLNRSHPLFGLWTGSFDVRGTNGALDEVRETFFFHSFMNQEPAEELLDLPQEPQFTSLILRRPRADVKKRLSQSDLLSASLVKDESQGPITTAVTAQAITTEDIASSDGAGEEAEETAPLNADGDGDTETLTLTTESAGEFDTITSTTTDPTQHPSPIPIGEPFTKYIVGFGRNPFGRFSLTAALNEKTGSMRCEKKYITTKGSGRRGRRPGTAFANASARLSNESGTSEGLGTAESTTAIRAMSTRPRKTLPDSALFYPSSYDDAQQLLVSGAHTKKRKPSILDDSDPLVKTKDKAGGSHQKGAGAGTSSSNTAFQAQREKERERDRERLREKERDLELEKELDDSNSDYRVAFLDEETGEVYEGGWYPNARRRHGAGICMYGDGTLYEGGWAMGREHGKGQLMTGDRQIIYTGEWVDGTMTGHGTYAFNNGDRYTGDWREGTRHGKGEYQLSNGCSYIGDWKNNKRTGSGVFNWADGSTYDGDWENDNRHGRGLLALANGFRYDGCWFQNYMEGRGVSVFPGGQEYQGSYKGGLREGRGSIKFAHGAVYEGRFRDDRIDGQGTIVVTETMPGVGEGEILIPIQIQADIRRIHLKAGFGADAAH